MVGPALTSGRVVDIAVNPKIQIIGSLLQLAVVSGQQRITEQPSLLFLTIMGRSQLHVLN